MTLDTAITLVLAVIAFACYGTLLVIRAREDDRDERLVFVDLMLVVASVEVAADTLDWRPIALVTQGALMAGAVALVATLRRR